MVGPLLAAVVFAVAAVVSFFTLSGIIETTTGEKGVALISGIVTGAFTFIVFLF